ncbi:MAG: NAD(P)/FAD-dependent oxidoreductase [Betaproteobacteria bacterium]|nr:NAD(P)/FAD-dependent oxidoreductase [Betaproteobacteria bacterium]MDH4322503.1 NAD(P)/FAD-dependent oxidoreductase [Betaproteobacteria bacterium]MDH5577262.1 NAD(P)/FAD-dependent oxidoreductase [Betaproteobacteria bacterium]
MSERLDIVIVGAGFAGLYMLHRARGLGLAARVFEAGSGVGGTWYWNRYPGARCDVESMEYSYQFDDRLQQAWRWSERFATQPEIMRYANHVADRFDLRRDIQFDTRVLAATYDEAAKRWAVRTTDGAEFTAQFLVMATGCLSSTNRPVIKGIDSFAGASYHTGEWPHEEVDFTGKRVGVIGTGSSAIQSIPIIAEQAGSLIVFQRTANYSVPAHNAPLDPAYEARIKADYANFRARNSLQINAFGSNLPRSSIPARDMTPQERRAAFEARWQVGGLFFLGALGDLLLDKAANDMAAEFVREKIRGIVRDPKVAELLSPKQVIGCKRLCVDSGYYATFNRPNVHLVDISQGGIDEITPKGVRVNGQSFELDALVFATGFDAMTGTLLKIDIRGRGGMTLREAWHAGPRTYLGLSVVGFPNLFTISGPGSPSVLTNMMVSIEQHVNWIAECIARLRAQGRATIEARAEAQEAWVEHVNAVAERTLYPQCNSWYVGANIPGKTRVFMPLLGFPDYVKKCDEVVAKGYEGFDIP